MTPQDPTEFPSNKTKRSWPQRALLGLNVLVIAGCFAGAGALVVARHYGASIGKVDLADASTAGNADGIVIGGDTGDTLAPGETIAQGDTGPVETLPDADPEAKNFLITGADNNACIDPDSPYAAAFGDRESMGERSDTIMVMRVDPATKRAAVLSFPRDLYVKIAGSNRSSRINSAFVRNDPDKLVYTLMQNFGVPVDHYIQIDFCAFKKIVDGLGGVAVPFDYPTRDVNTGLNVPQAGCFTLDGDHALAYVRSRKYQYMDDSGKWKTDPVGDLGRVSRQQDFLRRVLSAALARGVTEPRVARSLIDAAQDNVVTDRDLTLTRMLEFVGVLRNFEPGGVATYQIEAVGETISGAAVLVPRINGDNMQQILAIFKGEAPIAGAPEQVFETTTTQAATTTTNTATTNTNTNTTVVGNSGSTTTTATSTTTIAPAGPEENTKGIVPQRDVSC